MSSSLRATNAGAAAPPWRRRGNSGFCKSVLTTDGTGPFLRSAKAASAILMCRPLRRRGRRHLSTDRDGNRRFTDRHRHDGALLSCENGDTITMSGNRAPAWRQAT